MRAHRRQHEPDELTAGDGQSEVDNHGATSTLGGLRHSLDEAVGDVLPALLERLIDRLGRLFVRRVVEQVLNDEIHHHLAMGGRPMLEDLKAYKHDNIR
jgi:hypothetical protein